MFELKEHLLHPAISHFPVVLLVIALMVRIAQIILAKFQPALSNQCKTIASFLLYLSAPFFLLTMFLGDMALDYVKNDLCNLVMAYKHEELAETTLYLLIITIFFEALFSYLKVKITPYKKIAEFVHLGILIFCTISVLQTSHLGGKLVFEQGAGVDIPKKCH